jgi:hypothetical protein
MPHGLLDALSRRERDDDGGNSKDGGLVGRQDVTTNGILVLVFDFQFSTMLSVFKSRRSSRLSSGLSRQQQQPLPY